MKSYDIIFITNLPAFYKIKQWNELNKHQRLLAIYTGDTANQRNADFFNGIMEFDHIALQGGSLRKLYTVLKILLTTKYQRLILGGWDSAITLIAACVSPKKKNAVLVESSVNESTVSGLKGLLKKAYMKRMSVAYPSGYLQAELVRSLNFRGLIRESGGCGLLNYLPQPAYEPRAVVKSFLYVGRLSPEKNLTLLLQAFKEMPDLALDIVGFGPQEEELKSLATDNVRFLGQVNNADLYRYYRQTDAFILPSISEPWGLVVEEALNNGAPVIVSDMVGCHKDLVSAETGLVFESGNLASLKQCIRQLCNVSFYNQLRLGVSKLDFHARAQQQIDVFI